MNKSKGRVAIIYGGKSAEHNVSIQSARNVFHAIDKEKYDVFLIRISENGSWLLSSGEELLQLANGTANRQDKAVVKKENIQSAITLLKESYLDVVFPVLHGPYGEDGSIQGLFQLIDIPIVGSGVLGSAVGMDKDVMKRLLREAGLPVANFLVYHKNEKLEFDSLVHLLGLPFFVKPANMGSSIGVTKVETLNDFKKAVTNAFEYDTKIIIEKYIKCSEIECSVLGNDNPIASLPGEIVVKHGFYDYDAKYIDEHAALLKIPADLDKERIKEVQSLAVKAFKTLCLEGMARVDFFLSKTGMLYINEVNTIPGFTDISMYPKLWEASGISQTKLIDYLISLALKRHKQRAVLKSTYI